MVMPWNPEAVDGTGSSESQFLTPWSVPRPLPGLANGRQRRFLPLPLTVTNADVMHVARANGMRANVMPTHQWELLPSLTEFA
jgi:hypothetical protein